VVKKDNRGFSLIEMVIVIGIVVILASLLRASTYTLFSSSTRNCAEKINAFIAKGRVDAMSRSGEILLVIGTDSEGVYGEYHDQNGLIGKRERLGDTRVKLEAGATGMGSNVPLDSIALTLSFNRATGGLSVFGLGGSSKTSFDSGDAATILVSSAGKPYKVTIVATTGKHKVVGMS